MLNFGTRAKEWWVDAGNISISSPRSLFAISSGGVSGTVAVFHAEDAWYSPFVYVMMMVGYKETW